MTRGAGGGNRQGEVLCYYLCSLEYDVKGGLRLTSIVRGCSHDLVFIVELFPQSCLPPLISRIIPVELCNPSGISTTSQVVNFERPT